MKFCPHGHMLTPDNILWYRDHGEMKPRCRACKRKTDKKHNLKRYPQEQRTLEYHAERVKWMSLSNERALEMCEKTIEKVYKHLDEADLSKIDARTAATVMGIMLDKRKDLKGLPTQRISIEVKQKIEVLAPALMEEIQRRGLTIEGEEVEP